MDIKTYIIMVVGSLFTLLAPIQNFMYAMLILFSINFCFGVAAAVANREELSFKKALKFFGHCGVFFGTTCALFIIGALMDEMDQSIAVVKILCWAAIWAFGANIARNWLQILTPGSPWYKMVDLIYYILSVQFVEKFPIVKRWQRDRGGNSNENTKEE